MRIATAQRWLTAIYGLELSLEAERYVLPQEQALALLPPGSPRSGLAVVEEEEDLFLGLYFDARDRQDPGTVVEETSHLLCISWHALQGRRISRLLLELQGEVDRWVVARLSGRDGFRHFRHFRWADWIDAPTQHRYEAAHQRAHGYCRALARRFPGRADVPGLLAELRAFYRASADAKLCWRWP